MSAAARDHLRQALFGWLNLVLTAPSVYLWLGLPLIMRQHGWSGIDIGLFQLAGLPAVFKFALAAPVQRRRFGGGHYRTWAMLLCTLFALVLGLIGRQPLLSSRVELFALALCAALLATWADIPVNALAIKLLPEAQRMRAGGVRSAALSLGAIVGGGVMLLVQNRWGWRAPFWAMAVGVMAGVLLLLATREPAPAAAAEPDRAASPLAQYRAYLAQPGARQWTWLLLAGFPFVGAAWLYLKPLLLDHGFAPQQVAWVVGIGGGAVAALASLVAARVIKAVGVAPAIPGVALLGLLALAALSAAAWTRAGAPFLAAAAALVAVALGGAATLAFGLMMYFTRAARAAADYGVQASLFALSRLVLAMLAGALLDGAGYRGMLLGLTAGMAGVVVLSIRCRSVIADAVRLRRGGAARAASVGDSPHSEQVVENAGSFSEVATQHAILRGSGIRQAARYTYTPVHTPQFFSKHYDHVKYKTRNS